MRAQVAEECKNDYAAQLQKYNKEQNQFYFSDMPQIFNVSGKEKKNPNPANIDSQRDIHVQKFPFSVR